MLDFASRDSSSDGMAHCLGQPEDVPMAAVRQKNVQNAFATTAVWPKQVRLTENVIITIRASPFRTIMLSTARTWIHGRAVGGLVPRVRYPWGEEARRNGTRSVAFDGLLRRQMATNRANGHALMRRQTTAFRLANVRPAALPVDSQSA